MSLTKQKTNTMDCSRVCRLCAGFCPNQQLTGLDSPGQRIRTKLFRCSQIDLSLENNLLLPQNVCGVCIEKLEQSWNFAEAVAKAQDKLQLEFAQDPLANIKIEEENAIYSEFQLLTELLDEIKHDDHNYVARRCGGEQRAFNNDKQMSRENTILDEVTIVDVVRPTTAPEVLIPSTSNVYLNYEPQLMSTPNTKASKLTVSNDLSIPRALLFTRDMLRSFYDDDRTDFWVKVIQYFRETFDITEKDCNEDGTFNEKAHLGLSQHSWKVHNWKCFKCHKYFDNVDLLESHIENKHSADTFRIEYCCFDCDKHYGLLSSLKNHIYMMHRPELRFW